MLLSPTTWFRMPGWLAFRGRMRERDYRTSWREFEIRLLGFVFLGVALLFLSAIFAPVRSSHPAQTTETSSLTLPRRELFEVHTILSPIPCLALGGYGIVALCRTKWWVNKFVQSEISRSAPSVAEQHGFRTQSICWIVRSVSIAAIAVSLFMAWKILNPILQ